MDNDFTILSERSGSPFRSRSLFTDHWRAVAETMDYSVLVAASALHEALGAASRNLPRETGGVVVGRFLQDAEGPYSLVTGVICAPDGSGDHGRLHLTPELTSDLKHEASRAHPTADVIGWWHSHPTSSSYSATDLASQRIWSDRRQVGLLIFADAAGPDLTGTRWGNVYLGPESASCRVLGSPESAGAPPADTALPASGPGGMLRQPGGLLRRTERGLLPGRMRPGRIVLLLVIVLLATAAGYVGRRPSDGGTAAAADTPTPISWACAPTAADGVVSSYTCWAEFGSPADFQWRVHEHRIDGPVLTVQAQPGTAVQLYRRVGGRLVEIGSMPLGIATSSATLSSPAGH